MTQFTRVLLSVAIVAALAAIAVEVGVFRRKHAQLVRLRAEGEELGGRIAAVQHTREAAARQRVGVEANVARRSAERPYAELDAEVAAWFDRITQLKKLCAENRQWNIPELRLLSERQWFDLARDAKFGTDEERRDSVLEACKAARTEAGEQLRHALVAYLDDHGGLLPPAIQDIASHLPPAIDAAILARYEMRAHGNVKDCEPGDWLIEQTGGVAEPDGTRLGLSASSVSIVGSDDIPDPDLQRAVRTFAAAHGGELPPSASDLTPYLNPAPPPAALQALLKKSPEEFSADVAKKFAPGQ